MLGLFAAFAQPCKLKGNMPSCQQTCSLNFFLINRQYINAYSSLGEDISLLVALQVSKRSSGGDRLLGTQRSSLTSSSSSNTILK